MHCMMVIWWRWWISKHCISQTLVGLGRLRIVSVSAAARELKCCWIFLFNKWKVLPLMDGFPFITLPPNIFIKWYAVSHEYSTLCLWRHAIYISDTHIYIYIYIFYMRYLWLPDSFPSNSQSHGNTNLRAEMPPSRREPDYNLCYSCLAAGLSQQNTARENAFFFSSFGEWFFF